MRDSVRVPIRGTGEPGEAAHNEQLTRDRSSRPVRVPSRTTEESPQPQTQSAPQAHESSPVTVQVIDRIVSVAATVLRGGGFINPANKKYIALLEALHFLPDSLPVNEYQQILVNLKTLEKQQNTETAIVRPFLTYVIQYLPQAILSEINADIWRDYLQQCIQQDNEDADLAATQLVERLSFLDDKHITDAHKTLQSKLSSARYAAYALPTWSVSSDTNSTVAGHVTKAFADSPVSQDFFDSIYTRFILTEDVQQLQRSTITAVDHLEALGPNTIEQLQRRLGLINLDRYPRTQLHLLSALLASDKSTIERLHRRDVRVILVDAIGDHSGDLINIYDRFDEKTGTTLLFEVTKPSDFYRHLFFLDDYDIHPSTVIFAAHGNPKRLQFGQAAQSFDLSIRGDVAAAEGAVDLSQASLERIAREFMITGRGRASNGKRQKKIIIASCGTKDDFIANLPKIEHHESKPKGRSIDVSFADEPAQEVKEKNAEVHTDVLVGSDATSETILQFAHIPGTPAARGDF